MSDLSVLKDPLAAEMLRSAVPARLAYNWTDGTPRVVPIWFHWNDEELVFGTPRKAPKLKAIHTGSQLAVTIDGTSWPYHALMLRGAAVVEEADGIVPEYAQAAERYFGVDGGLAWIAQVEKMGLEMSRIAVKPTWACILDFETRFPSALAG